ncbi:hypothetical protein KM043_005286 [Ampulex compressa]|nr:hypothetical protein KM043_005286 [Ampulex compressa]
MRHLDRTVGYRGGGPVGKGSTLVSWKKRGSPVSTGRIRHGPLSVTPATMFGHVQPYQGRFYPRKSLGHGALDEYLRRVLTVRGILRRAASGEKRINSNGRGLRVQRRQEGTPRLYDVGEKGVVPQVRGSRAADAGCTKGKCIRRCDRWARRSAPDCRRDWESWRSMPIFVQSREGEVSL